MMSTRPISLHSDLDASQSILNTKTPGRKALKNRAALQENAIHSGAKTVLSKKSFSQTPFRPPTAHGKKPLVSVSVTRPLMDKTPFPNRVAPAGGFGGAKTPGAKGFKLSKLSLLVPEPEQPELMSPDAAPLLRPSSTRKSLRGRLSGTFKTPVTKGDHWNVSPGGLDMEAAAGTAEQAREESAEIADQDDEIEYMPPTAIERPYEPLFDLPDYKQMGSTLFELGHAPLVDDTLDVYYAADIEGQLDLHELVRDGGSRDGHHKNEELDLSDIDDDSPFPRKLAKPCSAPNGSNVAGPSARIAPNRTARVPTVAPRPQAPSRPATAIPQIRSSSRTTGSPSSTPVPGPAPTRTSVLRAAKAAAASNSATTPHPVRPTASAGARAASTVMPRKPAAGTAVAKPLVRSVTISGPSRPPAGPTVAAPRARSAAGGVVAGRARSATVTVPAGRAKAPGGAKAAQLTTPDDPLAVMLEKNVGGGLDEDFQFEL